MTFTQGIGLLVLGIVITFAFFCSMGQSNGK